MNEFAYSTPELRRIVLEWMNYINSNSYELALYVNDYTPVPGVDETDVTEATFSGYSRVGVSGVFWPVGEDGDVVIATSATTGTFTPTAASAEIVYGYYVYDTADGFLSWAQRLTTPIPVAAFVPIVITPRVKLKNCPDE